MKSSYQSLFNYTGNSREVSPVVVIDYKVYARDIEARAKAVEKSYGGFKKGQMENFMKACWAYQLNRGPDALTLDQNSVGFTIIVVDDVKGEVPQGATDNPYGLGYWRNIVGKEIGLPPYKGGRKPKDEVMKLAVETGYEYIAEHGGISLVSEELFEADDLAGELCRQKRAGFVPDRMMYLSTLDGDWQVLVDADVCVDTLNEGSPNIVWVNTRHFNDRVRGNPEVIDYYERKEGVTLRHPSEVSKLKNIIGDSGDNLEKGAGLRLFDLLEEDEEWVLSEDTKRKLNEALTNYAPNNKPEHKEKAAEYLISKSFAIPETPNTTLLMYNRWREKVQSKQKRCLDFGELYKRNEDLFV